MAERMRRLGGAPGRGARPRRGRAGARRPHRACCRPASASWLLDESSRGRTRSGARSRAAAFQLDLDAVRAARLPDRRADPAAVCGRRARSRAMRRATPCSRPFVRPRRPRRGLGARPCWRCGLRAPAPRWRARASRCRRRQLAARLVLAPRATQADPAAGNRARGLAAGHADRSAARSHCRSRYRRTSPGRAAEPSTTS